MNLPESGQLTVNPARLGFKWLFNLRKKLKLFYAAVLFFAVVMAGLLISSGIIYADGYPPYSDNGNGAVHFTVAPWPSESAWIPYTKDLATINDPRTSDPSNGGTSPQGLANVSSGCPDQSLPSIYWAYNSERQVLYFRWRVEKIANNYLTGGSYRDTNPWASALWTVFVDIDGDGFREFAFHIDGSTGSPSAQIDILRSIYSNTPSQSIDFISNPSTVFQVAHNPSAFVERTSNVILNFRNSFSPSTNWPNGSSENVWDYGTTRSTDISTSSCTEFFVDYQIPLAMLDASSAGGPVITADTPISMFFTTANSLNNAFQKDMVFQGSFLGNTDSCAPFADLITLNSGTIRQPVVDWISASGCGPATITAQIRDALTPPCTSTVTSVQFYYYYDSNANGIADDAGSSWTLIGAGAVSPTNPGQWTVSWNSNSLPKGQYLIGVRAQDATGNITWSHLTQAQVGASPPNYANPSPVPGVVFHPFLNTCGQNVTVTKTASAASVLSGQPVTFTITVNNFKTTPVSVTSVTDMLPPGFSYVSTGAGTLGAPSTLPAPGATGTIQWTFSPAASVPALSSRTLIFTANAATTAGTYTNNASAAVTGEGTITSNRIDIGVGSPSLSASKSANLYSVNPGDTLTYTITFSNNSPVNVTGVTITDPLPVGLTFIAASDGGTYNSTTRTITWNIGRIASLEGPRTVKFSVLVTKTANSKTINTATITSTEAAPVSASVSVYVRSSLNIDKTANKQLVYPSGSSPSNEIIYTINYQHTGTSNLTGVTITDPLPAGFSYLSHTDNALFTGTASEVIGDGYGNDNGICETGEPCTVIWTASGPLTPGSTGSVTVTVRAINPYTGSNYVINTATMSANEAPSVSDNVLVGVVETGGVCQSFFFHNATENVGFDGVRRISNTTSPIPADTGTGILVTAPVSGQPFLEVARFYNPPAVDDVTMSDAITTKLYIDRVNGVGLTIRGEVYDYDPVAGTRILLGSQDTSFGGNDKGLFEYTITPSGTLFAGHRILWVISVRSVHASQTVQLLLQFDGTVPNTLSNPATSTFANSHARFCSSAGALLLTKQVDRQSALPGQSLQYTLNFSNMGLNNVTGAQIVDTLPTGTSFVNATLNGSAVTPVGGTCPSNICTFNVRSSDTAVSGQITSRQSGTLVINAVIDNPLNPQINTLTNVATITSTQTAPISEAVTTNIGLAATPDISILKSASKTLLIPGDTVTYTLAVVNTGSATANNITVNDTMPTDTYYSYVAGSISGGDTRIVAGSNLTWTINSLLPGATQILTYQMLVASTVPPVPAGITFKSNTATATEAARNYTSNTVNVSITPNPILNIAKTVSLPAPYIQSVGTGNGTQTVFSATLVNIPVLQNSVKIFVNGTEVGAGSGTGIIIGDNLKNSTINFTTGALYLEFITPPANGSSITASYLGTIKPGDTIQYTIVVTSVGENTAQGVLVTDPIPENTTYTRGTLSYQAASQTDQSGDDNSHYDPVENRVVFNIGNLSKGETRTMTFRVKVNPSISTGSTAISNTGTVSATNTASKDSTASLRISSAPDLRLSKSAPSVVPYPLTTVTVGGVGVTTITVASVQFLSVGDVISVGGTATAITAINTTTRVLTLNTPVTAGGGTQVLPVLKFTLSYENAGNGQATGVSVRDTLAANLNFISAFSSPACSAAGQIITCNVGTLPVGSSGTFTIRARPTSTGVYTNFGLLQSNELSSEYSNNTVTTVGALTLNKTTTTPNVSNSGSAQATYTISVTNASATAVDLLSNLSVTDILPEGFAYSNLPAPSYAGGSCFTPPPAPSRVLGTDGLTYTAIQSHTAAADNRPITGANWRYYWVRTGAGGVAWASGSSYTAQNQPAFSGCIVAAGATLNITFTANIASTVGAGTYDNGVSATSTSHSIMPFDQYATTAEDVTITVPGDFMIRKAVTVFSPPNVQYTVSATNAGTTNGTALTVTDVLPVELTYVSSVPSQGGVAYDAGTRTITWTAGALNTGLTATLQINATINTFGNITNCASRTASTPADTNPLNDTGCAYIIPTLVTLSDFRAYEESGMMRVEWTTSSEVDTAGFYLYRLDEKTGRYRQINSALLPAVLTSSQGGTYSLTDRGASVDRSNTYVLVEIEGKGTQNVYGPFTVTAGGGNAVESSNTGPASPDALLHDNAVRKFEKAAEKYAGRITKYTDGDGTLVIANTNTSKKDADSSISDEVSGYTRKPKGASSETKARLQGRKAEKDRSKAMRKQRKGDAIKISMEREGLYYLDASEIAVLLGTTRSETIQRISTGNLALSSRGSAAAYLPSADNGGIFFFGQGIDSLYTKENIYWLYKSKGLQMAYVTDNGPMPAGQGTFTETVHAEENRIVAPVLGRGPESDYWFWDYIVGGNSTLGTRTFAIETHGAADLPTSLAKMTVKLHGLTSTGADTDHHAVISLNGTVIGEDWWQGAREKVITLEFNQGLLYSGANTISITGLLDTGAPYSVFYVNSFDLTYQRVYEAKDNALIFRAGSTGALTVTGFTEPDIFIFDITEPGRPVVHHAATGRAADGSFAVSVTPSAPSSRYLAVTPGAVSAAGNAWADSPSSLSSKNNRADYVIIAPDELADAAAVLATYRSRQGHRSMVVKLEDIMDEFNHGLSHPEAIREFLKYAHQNWKVPPRYVVLAGDGTYDYKNNMGHGDNLIPTLMAETPHMHSPSDNLLADLDGDRVPDIAIGRLPVLTAAELQNVITKIINYENRAGKRIVMLADNPDGGGDFTADSDETASLVPAGYTVKKIYLTDAPLANARQLLFDEINRGAFLLNYVGHAGADRLANEGLLMTGDVAVLQNAGMPLVLVAMTCTVGNYAIPGYDSLSESLLTAENTGAAAVWAPTGLSYNILSNVLDRQFFADALKKRGVVLGDVILNALRNYKTTGSPSYIMNIYNLQGDPALRIW